MNPRLDRLIRKHGLGKLHETIGALSAEATRLKTRKTSKPGAIRRGATKFGGAPDVPKGFRWPMRGKRALTFIGRLPIDDRSFGRRGRRRCDDAHNRGR